jgi:hypothetical protein
MQPQNVFDLLHRRPLLGHRIAHVAKRDEGCWWITLASSRPGPGSPGFREHAEQPCGHGGQQSGRPPKVSGISPQRRPSCRRNSNRHHSGIASVVSRRTHSQCLMKRPIHTIYLTGQLQFRPVHPQTARRRTSHLARPRNTVINRHTVAAGF